MHHMVKVDVLAFLVFAVCAVRLRAILNSQQCVFLKQAGAVFIDYQRASN